MTDLGQYEKARELFSKTLSLDPNHQSARKYLQSLGKQMKQQQKNSQHN